MKDTKSIVFKEQEVTAKKRSRFPREDITGDHQGAEKWDTSIFSKPLMTDLEVKEMERSQMSFYRVWFFIRNMVSF